MDRHFKPIFVLFACLALTSLWCSRTQAVILEERLAMAGFNHEQIERILSGETTVRQLQEELRLSMAGYSAAEIVRIRNARKMAAARPLPFPEPLTKAQASAWQRSQRYRPIVSLAASHYNIDKPLILAIIRAESDFNPRAVSNKGALGLMQLMPGTARELGVTHPFNPYQNIMAGTRFLARCLKRFPDIETALVAYNAGPAYARKAARASEVKAYVKQVLAYQAEFQEAFASQNLPS